eukprot:5004803-Pyramimonas_sp.AAC.1
MSSTLVVGGVVVVTPKATPLSLGSDLVLSVLSTKFLIFSRSQSMSCLSCSRQKSRMTVSFKNSE